MHDDMMHDARLPTRRHGSDRILVGAGQAELYRARAAADRGVKLLGLADRRAADVADSHATMQTGRGRYRTFLHFADNHAFAR